MWNGSELQAEKLVNDLNITSPLLLGAENTVSSYEADTDYLFIIDKQGIIRYIKTYGEVLRTEEILNTLDELSTR